MSWIWLVVHAKDKHNITSKNILKFLNSKELKKIKFRLYRILRENDYFTALEFCYIFLTLSKKQKFETFDHILSAFCKTVTSSNAIKST